MSRLESTTRLLLLTLIIVAILACTVTLLTAWTGPSQAPPNGNVSAPINVGTTDQVKNAGLSVNALAIFGNALLSGTSRYLNWGTTPGSSGYGVRDNAGTMEVKDSTGAWNRFATTTSTGAFNQVRFSDGTSQATAAGPGGISAVTTVACSSFGGCTLACPATYFRTGCSGTASWPGYIPQVSPSGTNACYCSWGQIQGTCYAYCAK